MSVIRLAVDTGDPRMRRRFEQLFSATFQLRRAVQADARSRVDAYWAAPHERAQSPKAVRERLGLTRKGLERAAQQHLHAAPHLADSVWSSVDRHLFADACGKRFLADPARWHKIDLVRYRDPARAPAGVNRHPRPHT